jgi:hypothetical protein
MISGGPNPEELTRIVRYALLRDANSWTRVGRYGNQQNATEDAAKQKPAARELFMRQYPEISSVRISDPRTTATRHNNRARGIEASHPF